MPEEINVFYQTVNEAIDSIQTKNLILMGDFNAKIGKVKNGEESILGQYSAGERNERGQRLVEYALEHQLNIVNSIFYRKLHKKWTWHSPNHQYHNEIDYIMTNHPRQIHNFDIINNLNFATDHRTIRCALSLNMKENRKFIKRNTHYSRKLLLITGESGKFLENKLMMAINNSSDVQCQYDGFEREIKTIIKELPKSAITKKQISSPFGRYRN